MAACIPFFPSIFLRLSRTLHIHLTMTAIVLVSLLIILLFTLVGLRLFQTPVFFKAVVYNGDCIFVSNSASIGNVFIVNDNDMYYLVKYLIGCL